MVARKLISEHNERVPRKTNVLQETYLRAAAAVAVVSVIKDGDEHNGSAFHIGDGIFLTARHVVDGVEIKEVASTKSVHLSEEAGGKYYPPRRFDIIAGPDFATNDLDVAVFRVDLGDAPLPRISVSDHTDFSFKEEDVILSDVLIIGYPPIHNTNVPSQVVARGQINAVVRLRHSPALHFIASAMARGGFSGGVALNEAGLAIGLVTESQISFAMPTELGFMSLLSIEHAVDLAAEKFGFSVHGVGPGRYTDTLFGANFIKIVDRPLSSFIYDASVFVYDDGRDVFAEIKCDNDAILTSAVRVFNAITPIQRNDVEGCGVLYTPRENPSPKLLLQAVEAVRTLLEERGYRMLPPERGQWQLRD